MSFYSGGENELVDEIRIKKVNENKTTVIKKEAFSKEKINCTESNAEAEESYKLKSENSAEPKNKVENRKLKLWKN